VSRFTFDLSGKVAIVTGGTKGLGYAMVQTLSEHGADVVITARTVRDCQKVAGEIEDKGRKALACPADVTSKDQVENLVKAAVEKFGRIDILVNNTGVGVTKSVIDITEDEWGSVIDTNLKSTFLTSQAVARIMIQQKSGNIINIASLGGVLASPNLSPYAAAKAGIIQLTKAQAVEWARHNIRVNCIAPGYVLTDMNKDMFANDKILNAVVGPTPMRRLGNVYEIAGPVLFLASDASTYMTGATILVDGGRHVV